MKPLPSTQAVGEFLKAYSEKYGEQTAPGVYRLPDAPHVKFALPRRAFETEDNGGISGIALTYGELIEGYEEVVRHGAFEDGVPVRLLRGHNTSLPAVGTVELAEVDGVYRFAGDWLTTHWGQDGREETIQLMDRLGGVDTSLGFVVYEYAFEQGLTPAERDKGAWGAIVKGEPRELSLVIEGAAPSAHVERAASMEHAIPKGEPSGEPERTAELTAGDAAVLRALIAFKRARAEEVLA